MSGYGGISRTLSIGLDIYANDLIANSILNAPIPIPEGAKALMAIGISFDKIRLYRKYVGKGSNLPPIAKKLLGVSLLVTEIGLLAQAVPKLMSGNFFSMEPINAGT